MGDPAKVQVQGPLAPFVAGYWQRLKSLGYVPDTISNQLQLIAHLSAWMYSNGLDVSGLTDAKVDRYFTDRRTTHRNFRTARSLRIFFQLLTELGISRDSAPNVVVTTTEAILQRFEQYLLEERGLRATTVQNYLHQVRPFLDWRAENTTDLSGLAIHEVHEFLLIRGLDQSVGSIKVAATALRTFLDWLYIVELIDAQLASGIGPVAYSAYAALPKTLAHDEVQRIITPVKATGPTPLRDQAIIVVLVRLGLRASEAAGLRLDDIHWRSGSITITAKGGALTSMPLPNDVGTAIADYLQHERPTSAHRHVFLTSSAPHLPLQRGGISAVVTKRGRQAGLSAPIRAHRLRHSAATAVLTTGGTLPEAASLLRHADLSTTAIYAKVHPRALHELTVAWPATTSQQVIADTTGGQHHG